MFSESVNFYRSESRTDMRGLIEVECEPSALTRRLEHASRGRGGALLFEEFVEIEQYGEEGYHAHHREHGATHVESVWSAHYRNFVSHTVFTVL